MADFLRELDPAHRAFLVIFIAVTIKSVLLVQWDRFKHAESGRPVPMKLRHGVYIPWGRVERVERAVSIATKVWMLYIAGLLVFLIYLKVTGQTIYDLFQ